MMSVDYIVSSLPALAFDQPAPISAEKFAEIAGDYATPPPEWSDLETQLRNVIAEARGGVKYVRHADGCSLYWKKRIVDAFGEKDVCKRQALLDRIFWDAAGELTPPTSPLSRGAIATYAIRLGIALRRDQISVEKGNAAFDGLTAASKISFENLKAQD